jgi:arylsulfatase A-like enzyme
VGGRRGEEGRGDEGRRRGSTLLLLSLLSLLLLPTPAAPRQAEPAQRFPNVVILTIDTLRADHLSSYGYRRPTTPNIDRLLAAGARFTGARTVEPLTTPALGAMLTSLYPHEHGATRNGMRLRPGLPSLARTLRERGYRTAAFVGNWTLKDRLSGFAEHFERYEEVFTRKRWLGLFKDEATAEDLTDAALAWLAGIQKQRGPFLLWVHYVDPHAPYRLHEEVTAQLGLAGRNGLSKADRYDSEIAFADRHLGRLLAAFEGDPELRANTLFVFAGDHGESLGEHGDWGHGRNLYEPALHIPLGIAWAGHVRPGATVDAPAMNLDVPPTVLGLLGLRGLPAPAGFRGFDWTAVLEGAAPTREERERVTAFEAHRGAVLPSREAAEARRNGLLAVGVMSGERKAILRIGEGRIGEGKEALFDLAGDPRETRPLTPDPQLARRLAAWLAEVRRGLAAAEGLPPTALGAEDAARLRALGYLP